MWLNSFVELVEKADLRNYISAHLYDLNMVNAS